MEPILQILDPYLKPQARILELGCGTGRLMNALLKKYPDLTNLTAADIYTPAGLDKRVKFSQLNFENLQIGGTYDLIIINQVLEHIKNAVGFMEQVKKLLAPGGTIYLALPNRYGYKNTAKVWNQGDGVHYQLWDKESLEFSLARIGLETKFLHLYEAPTLGGWRRYIPAMLRIQNPNLICLATPQNY